MKPNPFISPELYQRAVKQVAAVEAHFMDIIARPGNYPKEDLEFALRVMDQNQRSPSIPAKMRCRQNFALAQEAFSRIDLKGLNTLFERLHAFGIQDRFLLLCADKNSLVPREVRNRFPKWLARKNAEQELGIPPLQDQSSPAVSNIKIIEINHRLVIPGQPDMLSALPHNPKKDKQEEREEQERRVWLCEALLKNGISAEHIQVFKEKERLGSSSRHYPYEIIDIRSDKTCAQIIVCNWYGFITFINKDPTSIDPDATQISISDLRDNPAVFQIPMASYGQWLREIQEILYTPLEKLEPQLKHRLSWTHRKSALIDSFIAHIVCKGEIPRSNDNNIICRGQLAELATWARGYKALNDEHITGLEGITSFLQLYEHLQTQNPELASFLGAGSISAKPVFNDAAMAIRDHQLVLCTSNISEFEKRGIAIAGRKAGEVALAFRYAAIKNLADFVPAGAPIADVDDFMVLSGLARRCGPGGLTISAA